MSEMRLYKRGRVWWTWVRVDGRLVRRSTTCRDKRAAELWAQRFEREMADIETAERESATLGAVLELLLRTRAEEVIAGRRSQGTVNCYRTKAGHWIRLFELDARGERQPFALPRLRAADVDRFVSARRGEGAAESTIHKELVTLRAALKLAKRAGLWRGDVDELMPVAFSAAYTPRTRWLPREEFERLRAELPLPRAAVVAFILATSACWHEVELAQREDVRADLTRVRLRGTKTAGGARVVPIVLPWQHELLRFALDHADGQEGALFSRWSNVWRGLDDACTRAGIPRCSPNDLRRSFSKWMRVDGVPKELISPMMGHATTKMVETVYGKLDADDLAGLLARRVPTAAPFTELAMGLAG